MEKRELKKAYRNFTLKERDSIRGINRRLFNRRKKMFFRHVFLRLKKFYPLYDTDTVFYKSM